MMQEESMEGLFAQFDEVAEQAHAPAVAISATNLTHSRAPSLGTRLVRWILQGSGAMVIYLFVFTLTIARPQEAFAEVLGLVLITVLAAPLMGARPVAHPLRWALLLPVISALAGLVTVLARWPMFLQAAPFSPLSTLVLSGCLVAEKVTAPSTLALCVALGVLVIWLARILAKANPWVETRARWQAWRRVLGLSVLGVCLGCAVAMPLLYRATWSQAWLLETKRPLPTAVPQVYSKPDDLCHISQSGLTAKLSEANAYLSQGQPLTVLDLSKIEDLLERCQSETPSETSDRFVWLAYERGHRNELGFDIGSLTTRVFRQSLLHRLCASETSMEELQSWQTRAEPLEVKIPVSRAGADDIFLERLAQYRPGFPNAFLGQERYQRPLRLFGVETPWTPAYLSLQAERTLALLVYSHRRQSINKDTIINRELLAPPYTGSALFDQPLNDVFGSVTDELPYRAARADSNLFWTLWSLKKERAKTGRYPETFDTTDGLVYRGDGATARLSTPPSVTRSSYLYFNETLR